MGNFWVIGFRRQVGGAFIWVLCGASLALLYTRYGCYYVPRPMKRPALKSHHTTSKKRTTHRLSIGSNIPRKLPIYRWTFHQGWRKHMNQTMGFIWPRCQRLGFFGCCMVRSWLHYTALGPGLYTPMFDNVTYSARRWQKNTARCCMAWISATRITCSCSDNRHILFNWRGLISPLNFLCLEHPWTLLLISTYHETSSEEVTCRATIPSIGTSFLASYISRVANSATNTLCLELTTDTSPTQLAGTELLGKVRLFSLTSRR